MFIGIAGFAVATVLAICELATICMPDEDCQLIVPQVMRYILVNQNKQLEREELKVLKGAQRERIEEAARLEGITFEEALQRKRGFRYLL